MGEGTTRVANTHGSAARVRELGHETEATRQELDELVMELDRRRHQAFDWRSQVRRHARALALLGVVVVVGFGVAASIARKRRRQTLAARLSELAQRGDRLRLALDRIMEDPDRLAKKEPPARRTDAAAVGSLALGTARVLLPYLRPALSAMRRSGARAA